MKTTKTLLATLALSAGLLAATGANATLVSALRGQVVNDTDLNITWLSDFNYAKTSGYDADGLMTWSQAQGWIASLNAENGGTGHLGYNDWRLPTTLQPDASCGVQSNGNSSAFNCTGSEMGHLYYNELGNKGLLNTAGTLQSGYGLVNDPANPNDESLFTKLQSNNYWSGTEYVPSTNGAWYFNTKIGDQNVAGKNNGMFAMAVRPGQVAAGQGAVPVPAAAWLLGSGLLGMIGVARRRLVNR